MNQSSFYKKLIERYVTSTASKEEVELLFHLLDEEEFRLILDQVMDENLKQRLWEAKRHNTKSILHKRYRLAGIAASFILLCSIAVYFFISDSKVQPKLTQQEKPIEIIQPGDNRAVLTLANGKKIVLKEQNNGLLAEESGISVYKSETGILVYKIGKTSSKPNSKAWHTISTPNGGQYQVILEDGSKIWLNAASSITLPTTFGNKNREINISGEVYCEIAKDSKRPFSVNFGKQKVEVLGTHFNIKAYPEESYTEATLLEGSIKIANTQTLQSKILVPGQQAELIKKNNQLTVNQINTETVVAWKNGYFMFKKEPLESIMRQIARWYNVEIVYQADVSKKTFGGKISKFANVDQLLEVLSETGSVKFKTEGRRIIVMD